MRSTFANDLEKALKLAEAAIVLVAMCERRCVSLSNALVAEREKLATARRLADEAEAHLCRVVARADDLEAA